jgi:hypothetical protein
MPPAIAGTRAFARAPAIARKLCTGMNGPIYWGHVPHVHGVMCPNLIWRFSVSSVSSSEETEEAEEAPTFGRGSSHRRRSYYEYEKSGLHLPGNSRGGSGHILLAVDGAFSHLYNPLQSPLVQRIPGRLGQKA